MLLYNRGPMPIEKSKHYLQLFLGHFFVALGIIGAVLPIVPTTPFLILAAYFYQKASPKLHQKLLNLPKVGPILQDWDKYKIIRFQAKIYSSLVLVGVLGSTLYFHRDKIIVVSILSAIAAALLFFIWTRKSKIDPA